MGDTLSCTSLKQVDQGRFQCIQPDGTAIDVNVDKAPTTGQLPSIVVQDIHRTASDRFVGKTAAGENVEVTVHTDATTKQRVIDRADVQGADGQWRRYETADGLQTSARRFHSRAAAVGPDVAAAETIPVRPAAIRFAAGEEKLAAARERQDLRAAYQARETQITTAVGTAVAILDSVKQHRSDFVVRQDGAAITVLRRETPTDQKVLTLDGSGGSLAITTFRDGRAESLHLTGARAKSVLIAAKGLLYVDPPNGTPPPPTSGGTKLTPLERQLLQLLRDWQRILQPTS